MSPAATTTVKRTTRARKTTAASEINFAAKPISSAVKNLRAYDDVFEGLFHALNESKEEFIALQKEIDQVREAWVKEQRDHDVAILERNQQEETVRKRENETYAYETDQTRRKAEDEFNEKKLKWEKDLQSQKDVIEKDREELEMLRKQVAGFQQELDKAVKDASLKLQKELTERFVTERKLREQEVKSEQELLALKITNLTSENERQENEIVILKKSLEQATAQLKDVAVKVIESSSSKPQSSPNQEL